MIHCTHKGCLDKLESNCIAFGGDAKEKCSHYEDNLEYYYYWFKSGYTIDIELKGNKEIALRKAFMDLYRK